MRKYGLSFITDQDLFNHVKATAEKYRFSISLKDFEKNLIDPIALTFDSKIYGKDIKDIIESEILRQLDKSNTTHIGYFHQNIFKHMNPEWKVLARGFDVFHEKEEVYVEMKNKHNTMNSSSSQKTYMRMQAVLLKNPNATCLLVEAIARKSQDIPWAMSLDGKSVSNAKIRRVSIDKFYERVTGDKTSFKKLCEILPTVIDDVVKASKERFIENTVFKELRLISPDILKSLYLISFSKYEGFDQFKLS